MNKCKSCVFYMKGKCYHSKKLQLPKILRRILGLLCRKFTKKGGRKGI